MKILVLEGGDSNEREISFRSSKSVKKALKELGHELIVHDPKDGTNKLKDYKGKVDIVFPILHGGIGENGGIQKILEKHGFKYLGADSESSTICFYKPNFKKVLSKSDIVLPGGEVVNKSSIRKSNYLKKPFVLKPIGGGSSVDVFIVRDPNNIPGELFEALDRYDEMLIEELIDGVEITVPVLGKRALPVIEIIPPVNEEFDFENKYNGKTKELCPPENVSKKLQKDAQAIAENVHNTLKVRHLSRTDMIITPDGKIYVIELNTMPGLTDQSLFPKAAKQDGMDMKALVSEFVKLANEK